VAGGWLAESPQKRERDNSRSMYLMVGPRSLLDLRTYLRTFTESEAEMKKNFCVGCGKMCFFGDCCSGSNCTMKYHQVCAKHLFATKTAKCSGCSQVWGTEEPEAEQAFAASSDSEEGEAEADISMDVDVEAN
jgi:hypothetical protein